MFGFAMKVETERRLSSLALAGVEDARRILEMQSDIERLENSVETLTQIVNGLIEVITQKDDAATYMER